MRNDATDRYIETDVLIVGAAAAGARAAISAMAEGVRTLVVTKSRFAKGGATPTANAADLTIDGLSAAEIGLPGDRRDSPEQFFRDIVADGLYLNNQKMVEAYVRENPPATRDLIDWGMKVYSFEEAHSQKYVRGINTSGKELLKALGRGLAANPPEWLEDHMVVDLLTNDGVVCGAVAVDQRYGGITVISCRAVVIATGGWQNGWSINSASTDLTGDGQAMAYRAGAELIDMEMVQAMPVCLIWPPSLRNSYLTYVLAECGVGRLLNANGERFMQRYDPRMLERSTKEIVSVATALEVRAGRGTPHGGVYYTLEGTTREEYEAAVEAVAQYAQGSIQFKEGFPKVAREAFEGRAFEVGNLMHYMMGGIRTDEDGRANVPGLFAAGECTGGLWGASRVSSAVSEAVIHGRIAGRTAGRFAKTAGLAAVDRDQVAAVKTRVLAPLASEGGPAPYEVKRKIQDIAARGIGIVKDGNELDQALTELTEIEREDLPRLTLTGAKSRLVNTEWAEALQLRNLVEVLKLSAAGARHREESRGSHYRRDAVVMDNDRWLCNIVISRSGDRAVLKETPVVVTTIEPPKGRMTYEQAKRVATASLSIVAEEPGQKRDE
ncbi:MAG TPA: FAD-binding protein [Bacillota bacterium]